MEFKNGYNFIYEKKVEAARKLFASKIGRPDLNDEAIDLGLTDEEIKSAKLFYETKESIVASTSGIPTANDKAVSLTINGEPVIGPSGDEPGPKVGTPFEVGQSYDYIYYNQDLSIAEVNAILESLDYEEVMPGFDYYQKVILETEASDTYLLRALKISKSMFGSQEEGYYYFISNDFDEGSAGDHMNYVSEFVDTGDHQIEAGWYTSVPGQLTGSQDYTVENVNEWDKVKTLFSSTPFDGPTPPTPTTTPFYVGQVMEAGDIIHIDTSKTDELLAHLESIDWEGSSDPYIQQGLYPMICGFEDDGFALIAMNYSPYMPGLYALICGSMSGDQAIIWNSIAMGEEYPAGWHGLDENGNLILNTIEGLYGYCQTLPFTADTIYDIATPSWNGNIISFGGHGPEPTPPPAHPMLPFDIGDTITHGQIIYVDRHKEQDLIDYMVAVTEGQDTAGVELLNHANGRILWIHKNSSGYKLRLGGTKLIYSTYNDLEYGHKGWNDVDINGYYEVNLNDYGVNALTVAEVNDPEGAGINWNGNILGK